jgi:hypothetical protein
MGGENDDVPLQRPDALSTTSRIVTGMLTLRPSSSYKMFGGHLSDQRRPSGQLGSSLNVSAHCCSDWLCIDVLQMAGFRLQVLYAKVHTVAL